MYGKTTHNAQKVLYIEENKIFDSINQLSTYLHIKPQDISEAIKINNGILVRPRKHKIYHFKLLNNDINNLG